MSAQGVHTPASEPPYQLLQLNARALINKSGPHTYSYTTLPFQSPSTVAGANPFFPNMQTTVLVVQHPARFFQSHLL